MAEDVGQVETGASGPSPSSFGIMDRDVLESTPAETDNLPEVDAASAETPEKGPTGGNQGQTRVQQVSTGVQTRELSGPAAAQPPAERFSFMGKDYESRDVAEQSFRSWEGRLRQSHEENSALHKQLTDYYSYVQAAEQALKGTAPRGAEPRGADAKDTPSKFSTTVNWDQVAEIRRIAQATGEDPDLMENRYIAQQLDSYVDGKLDAMRTELSAPVQAMQDRQQFDQAASQAFVWARDQVDERGEAIYPELGAGGLDEAFVRNMHSAWTSLAQKYPDFAFSEDGLDRAYQVALRNRPAPPAAQATIPAKALVSDEARDARGRFVTATKAAATAVAPDSASPPIEGDEDDVDDGSAEFLARKLHQRAPRIIHTKSGVSLGFSR